MLWVLKRTVSMRRFFWAPKTYIKTDGLKTIDSFKLKTMFKFVNIAWSGLFKGCKLIKIKDNYCENLGKISI